MRSNSMFETPLLSASARVASTILSEMSVAATRPSGPTLSAAMKAATPGPVAMSSTRSPDLGSMRSTQRSEQCLRTGTK